MNAKSKIDSSMAECWSDDGLVYYVNGYAYNEWSARIGKAEDVIKQHPVTKPKSKQKIT